MIGIVGATASGKSSLAHLLALRAPHWMGQAAEIISMDAFALYRGMDIGTAKPSAREQSEIPHHQIDVLSIEEFASVARYQRSARADADEISTRNRIPIAVGGSGLYVRALFDHIEFPGTDSAVRERISEEAQTIGAEALHERLRTLDPQAAEALHPHNIRRVVRALEVIEITGKPFTATLPSYDFVRPSVLVGIRRDLADIDSRIDERTDTMFNVGFVDEVQGLVERGFADTPTASKATGYPSVVRYIRGEWTREEARDDVALQTRRLVRRQIKWFRRDPRIQWIDATGRSDSEVCDEAVRRIEMMR
ncbi:MAG: tRNA (adenosine(37)-N6)-dimethylallyltransferase MiaA [Actinomycetaceae bacterium]|nr:tRNA (adenosine(37)-N6)-dimethylallyltransferase MiaA [Actinomycetaceae bacterium]